MRRVGVGDLEEVGVRVAEEQGGDGGVVPLDDLVEVVRVVVQGVGTARGDVRDEPDALARRLSGLQLGDEPGELPVRIVLHRFLVGVEVVRVVEDAVI